MTNPEFDALTEWLASRLKLSVEAVSEDGHTVHIIVYLKLVDPDTKEERLVSRSTSQFRSGGGR